MSARAVLLALLSAAVMAPPAFAALGDEVTAGAGIARQLQAGSATCATLSDADFEHLGEYAMGRWVGAPSSHAAMNQRMAAVMGGSGADRMHQLMGRRYAGCGGVAATMPVGGGVGWMHGGDHHLSTAGLAAIVLGALALGAAIAALVARPRRRDGSAAPLA